MNTSIEREQISYNVAIGFEQFDDKSLQEVIIYFTDLSELGEQ